MALTRVSRHIIDDPFNPTAVSATDVTTTNINASGIGTVGTLRVTGDLTVEGTTTTLDSILTEVDRLEVSANSTVAAGIITQTGSGDILNLFDGSTEVFSVADGGDVSIVDKIIHAGDTDTAIRFPAGNTFTVETGGSERLRVRSNGVVAIGTHESTTINFAAAKTQIFNTGDRLLSLMYSEANSSGPQLNFAKGRDGDNSASTALNNNDLLGSLHFAGLDGSDFNSVGAEIAVKVDGTPGSNNMPGRIVFKTTASGASTSTERLRITSDGKVRVPDNGKFVAGAGDDLEIYHDGSNSFVKDTGTGALKLATSELQITNAAVDELLVRATQNGSVELFYDNSKKLETTTNGIQITGQIMILERQVSMALAISLWEIATNSDLVVVMTYGFIMMDLLIE